MAPFALLLFVLSVLTACRKSVPAGTTIRASGVVMDKVKNKPLPHAMLYLYGAHHTFYGIYYSQGPLDSTVSDQNGRFSIQFTADGQSIDYGLKLEPPGYGGYGFNNQTNYVTDYSDPILKFNYSRNVTNAVLPARELNYTRIHLRVLSNPFDSFLVRTDALWSPILIRGQSIDTTILTRHLPGQRNIIHYYTEALRDTAGLAALNSNPNGRLYSVRRMIADTIMAGMADTLFLQKTITNSLSMPRQ